MKRSILLVATGVIGWLSFPSALNASADMSCLPDWKLDSRELNCADRATLTPGNDTRTNLLLLMRDHAGVGTTNLSYPDAEWAERDFGATFFDWRYLRATYYPAGSETELPSFQGGRCASLERGATSFTAGLAVSKGVPATEREALALARGRLTQTCQSEENPSPWPEGIASAAGREYLAYLRAADAFYGERWVEATGAFAELAGARDPWVKETAVYMTARTALNVAQDKAFGEWGDFAGKDKVDLPTLTASRKALGAYLAAWPKGQYAASARGLIRRTMWLSGDLTGLAGEYEKLAVSVDASNEAAAALAEEADDKFLMSSGADEAAKGPLLLATIDLMMMREFTPGGDDKRVLSAEALAAQRQVFAGQPDLFSFLQASHAFYVAGEMKQVLALVPDAARAKSYSPLAFSRQMLRGMALAALKDPNEGGFWREMLGGAAPMHQRPLVELALAMQMERAGKLGEVFAKGSPITDPTIRELLLQSSAGPDALRSAVHDTARSTHERDVALFTLLYKGLTRGRHGDFVKDAALVRPGADREGGLWNFQRQDDVPVGLFVSGRFSDGYACPAIVRTAQTVAANPRDVKARLCLGDFLRLNGFDSFSQLDERTTPDKLGGVANLYPGQRLERSGIYSSIIDDKSAAPDDRAYALYRMVYCYAPSGYNGCGGNEVDISQRHAWHDRLKREFPASRWAKKLRFYW